MAECPDDRDAGEENEFIEEHGWREYASWHLGIDQEHRHELMQSLVIA